MGLLDEIQERGAVRFSKKTKKDKLPNIDKKIENFTTNKKTLCFLYCHLIKKANLIYSTKNANG
jgi:hypothetical protein